MLLLGCPRLRVERGGAGDTPPGRAGGRKVRVGRERVQQSLDPHRPPLAVGDGSCRSAASLPYILAACLPRSCTSLPGPAIRLVCIRLSCPRSLCPSE